MVTRFLLVALFSIAAELCYSRQLPREFSSLDQLGQDLVRRDLGAVSALENSLNTKLQRSSDSLCDRGLIEQRLQLAETRWETGDLSGAESDYRNIVEVCRECLTINDSLRIKSQYAASAELEAKGFYSIQDAEGFLRDALAGCNGSDWCKGKTRALLLRQAAKAFGMLGDKSSRDLYRESLRIFEEVDSPDSNEVAKSLWQLRRSLFEGFEREEAHGILQRLLRLLDAKPNISTPTRGSVVSAMGEDLHLVGDDAAALPYLREALALQRQEPDSGGCRIARTYGIIAKCLTNLARFDEAYSYYEAAIAGYASCGEPNPPYFFVSASTEFGRELIDHAQFERAEKVLERAAEAARDALAITEDAHLYLLLELARLYDLTGSSALAEDNYFRALTMAEMIYPLGDPRVSAFLEPYAEYCFEQGDFQRALPMQARAQKMWESTLGSNHPASSKSTENLSLMLRRSFGNAEWAGSISAARVLQVRAWRARFEQYMEALNLLSEYQLIRLATAIQSDAAHMYTMIAETPAEEDAAGAIKTDMPTMKALVWEVPFARRRAELSFSDPYNQSLADSLREVREGLAKLYIRTSFAHTSPESKERFDYLNHAKRRLTEELLARNPGVPYTQVFSNCNANGIASAIPANSAVVDFVRYEHDLTLRNRELRYLAYVIMPDSSAHIISLGAADPIDSLVKLYNKELSDVKELDELEYRRIARELCSRIWNPVLPALGDSKLMFVGPDGPLNNIAFESLVDDEGDFLIESYRFHYITSSRELNRIYARADITKHIGNGILAIGDVNFDAAPGVEENFAMSGMSNDKQASAKPKTLQQRSGLIRESLYGVAWSPLPATLEEIGSVARAWEERSSEEVTLLTQSQATERTLTGNCVGKRVIYIATHGFTRSRPVDTSDGSAGSFDDALTIIAEQNPLLQSGLVLSGANECLRASTIPIGDDGIATSEEISLLDLESVDLVVLSACQSGSGVVVNGEGVYSLRRAFELAGAKTIVSSLWAVDDNMTKELMVRTIRKVDVTIGEALHSAMLERIHDLRTQDLSVHPYYWAGFICSGDPRTQIFPGTQGDRRDQARDE